MRLQIVFESEIIYPVLASVFPRLAALPKIFFGDKLADRKDVFYKVFVLLKYGPNAARSARLFCARAQRQCGDSSVKASINPRRLPGCRTCAGEAAAQAHRPQPEPDGKSAAPTATALTGCRQAASDVDFGKNAAYAGMPPLKGVSFQRGICSGGKLGLGAATPFLIPAAAWAAAP